MVNLNAGIATNIYRQNAQTPDKKIDKYQEDSNLQKETKLTKVEDIKARIANGTYEIDLNATAKALATELLG